jgi:hypothetical protein
LESSSVPLFGAVASTEEPIFPHFVRASSINSAVYTAPAVDVNPPNLIIDDIPSDEFMKSNIVGLA